MYDWKKIYELQKKQLYRAGLGWFSLRLKCFTDGNFVDSLTTEQLKEKASIFCSTTYQDIVYTVLDFIGDQTSLDTLTDYVHDEIDHIQEAGQFIEEILNEQILHDLLQQRLIKQYDLKMFMENKHWDCDATNPDEPIAFVSKEFKENAKRWDSETLKTLTDCFLNYQIKLLDWGSNDPKRYQSYWPPRNFCKYHSKFPKWPNQNNNTRNQNIRSQWRKERKSLIDCRTYNGQPDRDMIADSDIDSFVI